MIGEVVRWRLGTGTGGRVSDPGLPGDLGGVEDVGDVAGQLKKVVA